MSRIVLSLLLFVTFIAPVEAEEALHNLYPINGKAYDIIVKKPEGKGPFPLLIIAPAKKYTMQGRLFNELAEGAVDMGYYTVRFNWQFVTRSLAESEGLSLEAQDIINVLKYFKADKRIDTSKVVLAAKSFGSRVAMTGPYKEFDSFLLITPNCSQSQTFQELYGALYSWRKPVHIVISNNDPYCNVHQIYQSMRYASLNMTIFTLFGDHNFVLQDKKANRLNEKVVLYSMINWLNLQL